MGDKEGRNALGFRNYAWVYDGVVFYFSKME